MCKHHLSYDLAAFSSSIQSSFNILSVLRLFALLFFHKRLMLFSNSFVSVYVSLAVFCVSAMLIRCKECLAPKQKVSRE